MGAKMIRCILLALLLCSTAIGQSSPGYITIFTHDNLQAYPVERDLVEAFERIPELRTLKSKVVYGHFTASDKLYRERFMRFVPVESLPCVLFQHPDGAVIYKGSGAALPAPSGLHAELKKYWELDPRVKKPAVDKVQEIMEQISKDPLCPDGKCPIPNRFPVVVQPEVNVDLPDSAEVFGRFTPVRDMVSIVVAVIGLIAAVFVIAILGVLFLGVLWFVSYAMKAK